MRLWNEEARRRGEGPGALRAGVAAARGAGPARASGLQPAAAPAGTARARRRPGGPRGREPASRPGKVCARGPGVAVGRLRGNRLPRGGAGAARSALRPALCPAPRRDPCPAPRRSLRPAPNPPPSLAERLAPSTALPAPRRAAPCRARVLLRVPEREPGEGRAVSAGRGGAAAGRSSRLRAG